jgi:5-(carboxyamino)imidazole ribonucleotide synthase
MIPSIYKPSQTTTIGIVGGGQLAKMLGLEILKMGMNFATIENGVQSPAGIFAQHEFTNGWSNEQELEQFVAVSDIVTLENEFIDPQILHKIAERRLVFPRPETIEKIQDKFIQKQTISSAGIVTTPFDKIDSVEEAIQFGNTYGYPFVLKTRTLGYDGYGNRTIRNEGDIRAAWQAFVETEEPRELLAEAFVNFSMELAVMVARNKRGETAVYPCVETIQENHICVAVIAPARISEELQQQAKEIAKHCVDSIDGVGMFGVEMFLCHDGSILFNEIAPRPHNSGHYTIEACYTSQFENTIRAVTNLPLGSPELRCGGAAMINLLATRNGSGLPDSILETLKFPEVSFHLYGKKDSRKGRKMGHITVTSSSNEEAYSKAKQAFHKLIW